MTEDDILVVREVTDMRETHRALPESQNAKTVFIPRLLFNDGRRYHGDVYVTEWAQQHPDFSEVRKRIQQGLIRAGNGGQLKCLAN